jgi:acyl carrier protein
MRTLLDLINEVLENNDKDKLFEISPNLSLKDDLGMDSLDLALLTVLIEQEYGIDVFEESIVYTVSDIENKING